MGVFGVHVLRGISTVSRFNRNSVTFAWRWSYLVGLLYANLLFRITR